MWKTLFAYYMILYISYGVPKCYLKCDVQLFCFFRGGKSFAEHVVANPTIFSPFSQIFNVIGRSRFVYANLEYPLLEKVSCVHI